MESAHGDFKAMVEQGVLNLYFTKIDDKLQLVVWDLIFN